MLDKALFDVISTMSSSKIKRREFHWWHLMLAWSQRACKSTRNAIKRITTMITSSRLHNVSNMNNRLLSLLVVIIAITRLWFCKMIFKTNRWISRKLLSTLKILVKQSFTFKLRSLFQRVMRVCSLFIRNELKRLLTLSCNAKRKHKNRCHFSLIARNRARLLTISFWIFMISRAYIISTTWLKCSTCSFTMIFILFWFSFNFFFSSFSSWRKTIFLLNFARSMTIIIFRQSQISMLFWLTSISNFCYNVLRNRFEVHFLSSRSLSHKCEKTNFWSHIVSWIRFQNDKINHKYNISSSLISWDK